MSDWSVIVADVEPSALRETLEEVVGREKFAEFDPAEIAFGVERAVQLVEQSDTGAGLVSVEFFKTKANAVRVRMSVVRDFLIVKQPAVEVVD